MARQASRVVWRSVAKDRALEERERDLLRTIEEHVIPQIIESHAERGDLSCVPEGEELTLEPKDVSRLAQQAVVHDFDSALEEVDAMMREGVSFDTVLIDLVAPAARLLGEQWEDDERSFADVTGGLGMLHQLVGMLARRVHPPKDVQGEVLLAAVPGEQHVLSLSVAAELLYQAGWGVRVEMGLGEAELLEVVREQRFAMVGLTVSNDELVPSIPDLVRRLRDAAGREDFPVSVGGAATLLGVELGDACVFSSIAALIAWLNAHVATNAEAVSGSKV